MAVHVHDILLSTCYASIEQLRFMKNTQSQKYPPRLTPFANFPIYNRKLLYLQHKENRRERKKKRKRKKGKNSQIFDYYTKDSKD